jgi:hypothetical protein
MIYDPSYGEKYQNLQKFEDIAIVGFALQFIRVTEFFVSMDLKWGNIDLDQDGTVNEKEPNNFIVFRRNPAEQDII